MRERYTNLEGEIMDRDGKWTRKEDKYLNDIDTLIKANEDLKAKHKRTIAERLFGKEHSKRK
jgi:hypothetical protein